MSEKAIERVSDEDLPAFNLLAEIDKRCRSSAIELPKIEEVKAQWSGIGFRVGNANLISPIGQIQEILTDPELTNVPGAKAWVVGVANNRGILLPVIDLSGYMGMGKTPGSRRNRVLVIKFGLLTSGLLVHEIRGQRHFLYEQEVDAPPELPESLRPYVEGAFKNIDEMWLLFNMRRLAETPEFVQAAA